jgi:FkbM family methyltransferase
MGMVRRTVKGLLELIGVDVYRLRMRIFGAQTSFDESYFLAGYFSGSSTNSVLIDVGVSFGSVSKVFLDKGWKVFGFEPDINDEKRRKMEELAKNPKFSLDRRAVSNESGKKLKFYCSDVSPGISSIHDFHASHKHSNDIVTVALRDFLVEKKIDQVDFLKIDTEGNDLFVLQGFAFDRMKPRIVLAEFDERKAAHVGYDYTAIGDLLCREGYKVYMSEWHPIVEYGLQHRFRRISVYPAPLLDELAWGNFIAVRNEESNNFEQYLNKSEIGRFVS